MICKTQSSPAYIVADWVKFII